MALGTTGVSPDSEIYFATPSTQAKQLFHYVLAAGDFTCCDGYMVRRERYDSILLMQILEGSCMVEFDGKTYCAGAGDAVLLNCYRPHVYFTRDHLRMRWLHFDGGQSVAFAEAMLKNQGPVFPLENPAVVGQPLENILSVLRSGQPLSEPTVSCRIHTMLCNLVTGTTISGALEPETGLVRDAIEYMQKHCHQHLTVQDIADRVSVSPSHFSRLFKRETGSSPYEYLLNLRLDRAKGLLKQTKLSISEIAEETGFASTSNFICAFHDRVGLSPAKFRATVF